VTRDEWRRKHERMQKRDPATVSCHPERRYAARGMCSRCYQRWNKAQRRLQRVTA